MMNLVKLKFFPIGFTINNNVIVFFLIKDLGIIINSKINTQNTNTNTNNEASKE